MRAEGFAASALDRDFTSDGIEHALVIRFSCDPVILRAEAMRLRELCWMDAEQWADEYGGADRIPVADALYEVILASSPDPFSPIDRGFEVAGFSGD